jgi:CheY-like chemotaxis protein
MLSQSYSCSLEPVLEFRLEDLAMLLKIAQSSASTVASAVTASVLVVEDNDLMRDVLRRMLERAGFAVVTAINGRDAVERFRERPVDVVVTDMIMPEMGGLQLIRALHVERPGVPIIAVSGVEYPHLFMARSCGAKATLRKPVPSGQLVETVQRVLAA